MKVYSNSMYGRGTLFVTPGTDHPETSDWFEQRMDDEGRAIRAPTQFAVTFKNGEAEVSDQLGRYLIDRKMASKRPQKIVLPQSESLIQGRPQYAKPIAVGRPLEQITAGGLLT